ncbi:MAG: uridine phosphorylase [Desulfurococcales archaeon]|nr:uridine phosphorylase [Desulfurococcales archaeon]
MRRLKSASTPVDDAGRQYHIHLRRGDVPRYVILPGDPGRVPLIAKYWDEFREVARHREYVTYVGRYRGVEVAATSTGIGGPATAIAIEELLRVGADTFIRVGTTGALQKHIGLGDVVISTAVVRYDGTSKIYVGVEYPAVADLEVTLALIEAAEELGVRYHVGITASSDSFYVGQGRPGFRNYMPEEWAGIERRLQEINVLNFEMESATIFTLANIYGVRAGTVCAAVANRVTNEFIPNIGVEDAIRVANEAVRILSEWDTIKKEGGFRTPSVKVIKEYLARRGVST